MKTLVYLTCAAAMSVAIVGCNEDRKDERKVEIRDESAGTWGDVGSGATKEGTAGTGTGSTVDTGEVSGFGNSHGSSTADQPTREAEKP